MSTNLSAALDTIKTILGLLDSVSTFSADAGGDSGATE